MAKEKVYAVIGLGAFGSVVCRTLAEKGGKVIAVDMQSSVIEKIKDEVTQALLIDSMDEEALQNAGLEDVDVAVVAIGDNMDASIITTAILKNMNIPYIIARAVSNIHAKVLKQVGASEVIYIEVDGGQRLAKRLVAPDILEIFPLSRDLAAAEIKVQEEFAGKSIIQLDVRRKFNLNIVAMKRPETIVEDEGNLVREDNVWIPDAATVLDKNDILMVIGRENDIDKLRNL